MDQMHDLIEVYTRFIDENIGVNSDLKVPPMPATTDQEPNKWGTCAFQWLHAVVGQAHAAKWLWSKRKNPRRDLLLQQLLERLCGQEGIVAADNQPRS